tara:strand:+ start:360 stop:524 length:165 start_codon:yes stop_codon:yes gene_type:complete
MSEAKYEKYYRRLNGKMTVKDMKEFNARKSNKNYVAHGGKVWSLLYKDFKDTDY